MARVEEVEAAVGEDDAPALGRLQRRRSAIRSASGVGAVRARGVIVVVGRSSSGRGSGEAISTPPEKIQGAAGR